MKTITTAIGIILCLNNFAQVLSLQGDSYILINDTIEQKRITNKSFINYDRSKEYIDFGQLVQMIPSDMEQRRQFIYPKKNWDDYVILQDSDGFWGVINKNGEILVDFKYKQSASFLNDNYYAISDGEFYRNEYQEWKDGRRTTIYSKEGKKVRTYSYNVFENQRGGRRVYNNGLIGFIDSNMNEILPCVHKCTSWDDKNFFFNDNGLLALKNNKGLCGVVNKAGKIIVPFNFDFIEDPHWDYNMVILNGKYGAIDTQGNLKIEPKYDYISYDFYNSPVGWVKYNGKWMIINKALKSVFNVSFDSVKIVDSFKKEMEVYQKDKGWGVIKTDDCSYIIPAEFDETSLSKDQIWTKKGSIVKIFDLDGTLIDQYDETLKTPFDDEGNEVPGFINKKGGKKGFTSKGITIIPTKYDVIIYDKKTALFFVSKKGKCGWINMKGEIIIDVIYDFCYSPNNLYDENYKSIGYGIKMFKGKNVYTFNEKGEMVSENTWNMMNPSNR